MVMYLVKRYEDALGPKDHGVANANYIVGLFSTYEDACKAVEKTMERARELDFCDEYYKRETDAVIYPIEVDKYYKEAEQEYIGGGFYVE